MKHLNVYSAEEIKALTRQRANESKLGEHVYTLKNVDPVAQELAGCPAKFVLLGLPEDIGVRANYGRGGAHTAWQPALENILNLQNNRFLKGEELLVLGHIDFSDLMEAATRFSQKEDKGIHQLRQLVTTIDERVTEIIQLIVSHAKIPIIIGGGHNNAYPVIKGSSQALLQLRKLNNEGINVINCDPHTDFRMREGRHSGNGFSFAFEEKYLRKYSILGIHESYNTEDVLNRIADNEATIFYSTYEDIFVRQLFSFKEALNKGVNFCRDNYCGIELDLDAITNVPSSAKTSSGISPLQARQYIYHCAHELKACYLHISEGAPVLAHLKADNKTGKLIAYLVADFIKGMKEKQQA